MKMMRHQNSQLRETVDTQTMEMFKVEWDFEQYGLVEGIPAHGGRVELDDLKGPLVNCIRKTLDGWSSDYGDQVAHY